MSEPAGSGGVSEPAGSGGVSEPAGSGGVSQLDALLALQEHDTTLDQIGHRRETLPERALIHELNVRRRAAESAAIELATRGEQVAGQEVEVETELGAVEQRANSLDATLRAPGGSGTRDAQAIINEIDHLRARASVLEERGLLLLEERDQISTEQAEIAAALDAVATDAHSGVRRARGSRGRPRRRGGEGFGGA